MGAAAELVEQLRREVCRCRSGLQRKAGGVIVRQADCDHCFAVAVVVLEDRAEGRMRDRIASGIGGDGEDEAWVREIPLTDNPERALAYAAWTSEASALGTAPESNRKEQGMSSETQSSLRSTHEVIAAKSISFDNGFKVGAEQMRARCSSREVAIDIACEAHRIYGQRDARDTDGYDGALAEFIEYKISNLPLRGKK